jgi:tetratricopeptide (TPR) repeat protein
MLEGTHEHWWHGQAYWVLGINLFHAGEFDAALEASDRLRAVARTFGDSRLEACADWTSALILARRGRYAAAVEVGHRGLGLCRDPFDRAFALWHLGQVHYEQSNHLQAIACLEEGLNIFAASAAFKQHRSNFGPYLAEAYAVTGRVEEARETAALALQLAESVAYGVGIGASHRALGRIAWIRGDADDAEAHLSKAVETFRTISARFLQAQAQIMLAEIRMARAAVTAVDDLREAYALCTRIQLPPYESRCARLAESMGIALAGEAPPLRVR